MGRDGDRIRRCSTFSGGDEQVACLFLTNDRSGCYQSGAGLATIPRGRRPSRSDCGRFPDRCARNGHRRPTPYPRSGFLPSILCGPPDSRSCRRTLSAGRPSVEQTMPWRGAARTVGGIAQLRRCGTSRSLRRPGCTSRRILRRRGRSCRSRRKSCPRRPGRRTRRSC